MRKVLNKYSKFRKEKYKIHSLSIKGAQGSKKELNPVPKAIKQKLESDKLGARSEYMSTLFSQAFNCWRQRQAGLFSARPS